MQNRLAAKIRILGQADGGEPNRVAIHETLKGVPESSKQRYSRSTGTQGCLLAGHSIAPSFRLAARVLAEIQDGILHRPFAFDRSNRGWILFGDSGTQEVWRFNLTS